MGIVALSGARVYTEYCMRELVYLSEIGEGCRRGVMLNKLWASRSVGAGALQRPDRGAARHALRRSTCRGQTNIKTAMVTVYSEI